MQSLLTAILAQTNRESIQRLRTVCDMRKSQSLESLDDCYSGKQLSTPSSTATTTSALPVKIEPTIPSSATTSVTAQDAKTDERHRHKRVKLDNDVDHSTYSTLNQTPNKDRSINNPNRIQISSPTATNTMGQPTNSYIVAQSSSPLTHQPTTPSHTLNNNYVRLSHPNSITPPHAGYLNSKPF